jgi:hypothetical protein
MTYRLVIARSGATKQSRSSLQLVVQIAPFWIGSIDKIDLLMARAGLYLLLSSDGTGWIVSRLVVDELRG